MPGNDVCRCFEARPSLRRDPSRLCEVNRRRRRISFVHREPREKNNRERLETACSCRREHPTRFFERRAGRAGIADLVTHPTEMQELRAFEPSMSNLTMDRERCFMERDRRLGLAASMRRDGEKRAIDPFSAPALRRDMDGDRFRMSRLRERETPFTLMHRTDLTEAQTLERDVTGGTRQRKRFFFLRKRPRKITERTRDRSGDAMNARQRKRIARELSRPRERILRSAEI